MLFFSSPPPRRDRLDDPTANPQPSLSRPDAPVSAKASRLQLLADLPCASRRPGAGPWFDAFLAGLRKIKVAFAGW
ncbi:hypothetical protein [Methylobrevis pamukkalensis]|uniref:hypothetical protein n=1 Tax=Methylobrevis pamukkalensis TaxID=1439726 RepID=UPI001471700A|nr:hypothetical protein [Methylobrevis pamukkalensis]